MTRSNPQFILAVWLIAAWAALLLDPANAPAVNKVWIKPSSGNWSAASNWSPNGIPQTGDAVFLTSIDPASKVIDYDDATIPTRVYSSILIDDNGAGLMTLHQFGFSIDAGSLTIGLAGPAVYNMQGGTTAFGAATLNAQGQLTIAAGSAFGSANFFHNGGTLASDATLSVAGTYTLNSGSFVGVSLIASPGGVHAGTFISNGGLFTGTVTAGTFIDNAGTFAGYVDAGKLIINGNAGTFLGNVTNHSSYSEPSSQSIFIDQVYEQVGGTFTQMSSFVGPAPGGISSNTTTISIGGGAAWNQPAGFLQCSNFIVGSGSGGAGSYTLSGTGSANFTGMAVGDQSDGTIVQSAGTIRAAAGLVVGGAGFISRGGGPFLPGQRGFYRMDGGTLNIGGLTVGAYDAISGTFLQTGGDVECAGSLAINVESTSSGAVNISAGTFHVVSRAANEGTFTQGGGAATIDGNLDGAGSVSVTGSGLLHVGRLRQNSLFVGGNGLVSIGAATFGTANGVGNTNRLKSIAFEQAGTAIKGSLDVGNNRLVIDYDGASPAADIQRYLTSGFAGGSWTGTGIRSGAAGFHHGRTLAMSEASDVFGPAGGVFGGVAVDGTAILIDYTFGADANLDGQVDVVDLGALASHWQGAGSWKDGDFNYDGRVDVIDLGILASNWQAGAARPLEAESLGGALASLGLPAVPLPEPVGVVAMAWAVAVAGGRFGRRC